MTKKHNENNGNRWLDKKASAIFTILIVIAGIAALTMSWSIIMKQKNDFSKEMGLDQLALFESYQLGEEILAYLDGSVKMSSIAAANSIAGGKWQGSRTACGTIDGQPLWNRGGVECYPSSSDIAVVYAAVFNERMEKYAMAYLPEGNKTIYEITHPDETSNLTQVRLMRRIDIIVRDADKPLFGGKTSDAYHKKPYAVLSAPIEAPLSESSPIPEERDPSILSIYSIMHTYSFKSSFDIEEYLSIVESAKVFVDETRACEQSGSSHKSCMNSNLPSGWEVSIDREPIYFFSVESPGGIMVPSIEVTGNSAGNSKTELIHKPLVYTVALDFSN